MPGSTYRRGGRQKGTPNKAKIAAKAEIADARRRVAAGMSPEEILQLTPLQVMLYAMHQALAEGRVLVAAAIAKDAAPYVHPKLASQKLIVQVGLDHMSDADLEQELADIQRLEVLARGGRGGALH